MVCLSGWSHPVRVRGLKHRSQTDLTCLYTSHPVRVRGLKPASPITSPGKPKVAPRAGAWIETSGYSALRYCWEVAPRAGAWIET